MIILPKRDFGTHLYELMENDSRLLGETVLQVGARPNGGYDKTFKIFKDNGFKTFHIIEVHAPNVLALKRKHRGQVDLVVQGDVRKINENKKLLNKYDTIVWWHGPEHVSRIDFSKCLPKLEEKTNKTIIVACPWGKYKQGGIAGNANEKHVHHWLPKQFESLGFEVYAFGAGPDKKDNLMGIKYV